MDPNSLKLLSVFQIINKDDLLDELSHNLWYFQKFSYKYRSGACKLYLDTFEIFYSDPTSELRNPIRHWCFNSITFFKWCMSYEHGIYKIDAEFVAQLIDDMDLATKKSYGTGGWMVRLDKYKDDILYYIESMICNIFIGQIPDFLCRWLWENLKRIAEENPGELDKIFHGRNKDEFILISNGKKGQISPQI